MYGMIRIKDCKECPFLKKDEDGYEMCGATDLIASVGGDARLKSLMYGVTDSSKIPAWCPLERVKEVEGAENRLG